MHRRPDFFSSLSFFSVFFFLMTCLQHLVQQMISEVHKMLSEFFLSGKNMINKLVDIKLCIKVGHESKRRGH